MNVSTLPILLVEDDPNDALLLQRAFRKANLANPVRVVEDGDAAVQYLAGEGAFADRLLHPLPVLMLLDLKLPRRSGHEVLEWVRAQPGLKRLPVVVLTSSERAADVDRAFDLGASAYLVKPIDRERLVEMVRTIDAFWLILSERPRLA